MTKARLETFSDGVLAIVITLLALELRPPEVEEGETLARALWEQWPSYLAYLLAFAQIGVIWLNHHRLFDQVRRVDGILLLLNLNLLMWITLIPFPTTLVAEHLRGGGEATKSAVAVFSGVLFMTSIGFTALYAWITHDERLVHALPRVTWWSRPACGSGWASPRTGWRWAWRSSCPTPRWRSMR
jgi:uncharacterized membrane protein